MASKRESKLVTVRIAPGAVLWHEGRAHYEGHELDVPEADAKALEESEAAERVPGKARSG
jgi:hypothetical protein